MSSRTIVVTSQDLQRLRDLIQHAKISGAEDREYLQALAKELDHAEVVEPRQIPPDVITMNSTVRIREDGRKRSTTWTIVFPDKADIDENRISVLAPIGTALLGYRVGDEVEWDVPAGRRHFHVEAVTYQPEAAGHYER